MTGKCSMVNLSSKQRHVNQNYIKTQLTPVRKAIIKQANNDKMLLRIERGKGTHLQHQWGCELTQTLRTSA